MLLVSYKLLYSHVCCVLSHIATNWHLILIICLTFSIMFYDIVCLYLIVVCFMTSYSQHEFWYVTLFFNAAGAAGPEPSKLQLPNTDLLYDLTSRNISDWLVKTTWDYKKKRSVGHLAHAFHLVSIGEYEYVLFFNMILMQYVCLYEFLVIL